MKILQLIANQAKVEVLENFEKRLNGSKKGVGHPDVATEITDEEPIYKENGPDRDRNYLQPPKKKAPVEGGKKKRQPEEPRITEQIWLETHGFHWNGPEG